MSDSARVLDRFSPHTRALKDAERKAALEGMLGAAVHEPHLITCPHCIVSGAIVSVKYNTDGTLDLPLKEPVKCLGCGEWFKVRMKIKMVGAPLDLDVAIAGSRG